MSIGRGYPNDPYAIDFQQKEPCVIFWTSPLLLDVYFSFAYRVRHNALLIT